MSVTDIPLIEPFAATLPKQSANKSIKSRQPARICARHRAAIGSMRAKGKRVCKVCGTLIPEKSQACPSSFCGEL